MNQKTKKIIGWVLAGLLGALQLFSAMGKLTVVEGSEAATLFQANGIFEIRHGLGIMSIIITILFLIPRTSTIGLVLMVGYWGGALATDLSHNMPPYVPMVVLFVLGLTAIVRNPELLDRVQGKH